VILVDPAVGSKDLVEPLRALGLPVEPARIDADLAFEGRGIKGAPLCIGVEYKKLGELVQSLRSERLQGHQLLKMQSGFDFRWLLIEGEVLTLTSGHLARRTGRTDRMRMGGSMTLLELYKRLLTLQICGGLQPVFVETRAQSLAFIHALYRTWTDHDLDQHKSHIAIYEPHPLVPISQFRRTVATLPGIGLELSGRVEAKFACLEEAFTAPVSSWTQVEGVGTKKAEAVRRVIREGCHG
jgi:ERCC4-type nuclease